MPRRRSLFPSLVALLLVGSCLSAAAASAGSSDPRLEPRKADVKLAKRLLIPRGALPGGFVDKGRQTQSDGVSPDASCSDLNLHALVMTADVNGHNFVRSSTGSYASVTSEATFFRSTAEAERAVAAMMTGKTGTCFKRSFVKGLNKSSNGAVKIVSLHMTPISENVRDLHVRVWDMFLTFEAHGLRFRDELVVDFLRRGRVVSSMMLDSLNGLSEPEVQEISQTLTSRLESLPKSAVL